MFALKIIRKSSCTKSVCVCVCPVGLKGADKPVITPYSIIACCYKTHMFRGFRRGVRAVRKGWQDGDTGQKNECEAVAGQRPWAFSPEDYTMKLAVRAGAVWVCPPSDERCPGWGGGGQPGPIVV